MSKFPIRALGLAAVTWCAAAAGAQETMAVRVRVVLPAYRGPIAIDTMMVVSEQDAPAGAVWSAASKVFYAAKIATDLRDSVGGVVGTSKYLKSSYIGDFAMSRVLNCGTSITGPNADNFRINLAIVAIVSPISATRSKLGIGFVGSGTDMRGSATNPVECASTGQFEGDFVARVKKLLAAGP